jgi:LSD1 subclass zinc finger protein
VAFWNFRARLIADAAGAPVLGLPSQTLTSPGALGSLGEWLQRPPGHRSVPDCFVSCTEKQAARVERALATISIIPETATEYKNEFGNDVVANSPPTFAPRPPEIWGPFQRGLVTTQLATIVDGQTALVLPAPDGFGVRDLSHVRLTMHDLPLSMPVTQRVAESVYPNAVPGDGGVRITTSAMAEWNLDIRLPTAARALSDWASDRGFDVTPTREAMDAEAILRRLGSLAGLDVLASEQRIELLQRLAPLASGKLAQRLVAELKTVGETVDEAAIREQLASMSLFLELRGRTAAELAGLMGDGVEKTNVLGLLPDLVAGGFVRRARDVVCPECRYRTLLALSEQAEMIRCRACQAEYALPVVDGNGTKEPDMVYRLDGLMARAMSQDILPVLLALRAFAKSGPATGSFAVWPGLQFKPQDGSDEAEVDLLVSFGTVVFCCEVKKTAHALKEKQLGELLKLCERLQTRPAIAALDGQFAPGLRDCVANLGGRILDGGALLAETPEVQPPRQYGKFAGLVTQSGVWG